MSSVSIRPASSTAWSAGCCLLGQVDGDVARTLRHAEIDRIDQRKGDGGDDVEQRVPFAGLALRAATPASGTNWPSISTSCEPVPRMPSVRQVSSTFTCGAFIGTPKCSTTGLALAFEHGAGHQQVAGRRARGEHLARGDPVAALDLLGLAGAGDPVGAAARQSRMRSRGDPPQQRLDRHGLLMPSSATPEWRPGACAWRRRAPSSRSDSASVRSMRRVRRRRRRRRRVPPARRLRPGRTPSAGRNCRQRSGLHPRSRRPVGRRSPPARAPPPSCRAAAAHRRRCLCCSWSRLAPAAARPLSVALPLKGC